MQDAIVAQKLGKYFHRYHSNKPRTLQQTLIRGPGRLKPKEVFWGLRDVSFRVEAGTMVGVIGSNGSGKSTLLQLIGGIQRPDEGRVEVNGRVGAFLDLKAGFRSDLTGRENVFIGGIVAGLTRREVARRFDSIIDFAELDEVVDNYVYTYSTGMQMRLAFAIAAHTDPEILLIDEVLAVGDIAFRRKCFDQIEQFKLQGCAILLVTHDTAQVQAICDQALWLREGQLAAFGEPDEVVNKYVNEMMQTTRLRTLVHTDGSNAGNLDLRMNENRFGSQEMEIAGVRLLDENGEPVSEISSGDPLRIEIEYNAPEPIEAPVFGVTLTQERQKVCSLNTASDGIPMPTLHGRGKLLLQFARLDLSAGDYYIDVGVYKYDWEYVYDYHWHVYLIRVHSSTVDKGILRPPRVWKFADITEIKL